MRPAYSLAIFLLFSVIACSDQPDTERLSRQHGRADPPQGVVPLARFADLDSYRYKITMEGYGGPLRQASVGAQDDGTLVEFSGAFVKPDRAIQTVRLGSFSVTETTIGRQQWTSVGASTSGPETLPETPPLDELSALVDLWDNGLSQGIELLGCSGNEVINGVLTQRCGLDNQSFQEAQSLLGAFDGEDFKSLSYFALEAWLSEQGGVPLRIRIEMAGRDLQDSEFAFAVAVDVTDLNSSAVRIEPPRGQK